MKRAPLFCHVVMFGLCLGPVLAEPPVKARKLVERPSDLPSHTYTIQGRPSEMAKRDEAVAELARQVQRDLESDLETFEIRDPASLASLHTTLYVTSLVLKDYPAAGRHLDVVRGSQESGTSRLLTGLLTEPLILASRTPGKDLHETYRALLTRRLGELPFQEVKGFLERMLQNQKAASREQVLSGLAGSLDAQVKGGTLSEDDAGTILVAAMNLHVTLPMREDIVSCMEALFEAHRNDRTAAPVHTSLSTSRLDARGAYFGQTLPGETPVPFAPEILKAVSPWVCGIAFSPDGTECFLCVGSADYSRGDMYQSRCVNGSWQPLETPAFLKDFATSGEPVFLDGGRTLLFTGKREGASSDLWTVPRTANGWGTPVALPGPINTSFNEYRGSFTRDGTFYFGSERASAGINQVFRGRKSAEGSWTAEKVEAPLNALSYDGDPCVAPDGRWIVTYGARKGGFGRVDLYVSFSDGRGGWGQLVNLGPSFNTADEEWGACLSTDGKYLFFVRHNVQGDQLYWVSASAIDRLKP